MYNASADVKVLELVPNEVIKIEWGKPATLVNFQFTPKGEEKCLAQIEHHGFHQQGSDLYSAIADSADGFSSLLAGAKAWLEHGIELQLVRDKFPSE